MLIRAAGKRPDPSVPTFRASNRKLLVSCGLAFTWAFALSMALRADPATSAQATPAPPASANPPKARVAIARDAYFGETLDDPYRWMEDDKDAEWLPFLKGQNDHTRAVLDALPGRAALLERIGQLSGDTVTTNRVQRVGGKLFFQQRPLGADNFQLFVREAGKDRVLVDPIKLSGTSSHVSLDWWQASRDGALVAYGLSKDGSEDSVLHVLTVATGVDLPEQIADTQDASPQWLDDGSGFFYNQLTGKVGTPERFLDSQARFHRLGTDPASDPILMKRGLSEAVAYERIQAPFIVTFPGSKYALLVLHDVRQEGRALIAPLQDVLAGHAAWSPVAAFEDEVTGVDLEGDNLYLLSNKGAPRGRLLKLDAAKPDLASATEVVPQGPLVLEDIKLAKDGLYLKMMDGGISRLRRLGRDGRVSEINLPFDGTVGALFANPEEEGMLFPLSGWLTPTGIWSVAGDGKVADTGLTPRPAIDVSPYESQRLFATAKDGTKIPYSLIFRKGLKLDGSAPAFVSAYGSYGATPYTPAFVGRALALIDAGCVVGYANVRGGGEYGREWHKAGQLANKPNTWRDLIAVCEDLCAKKYTAPAHLGHRWSLGGRDHRRPRPDRAPGLVCSRGGRGGLVQSPALRGGAKRVRRGTRVGRDQGGVGLSRAQEHRQLPGGQRWHRLSGRVAHDGGDRPARGAVPRGEDGCPVARGQHLGQADLAAGGLRRRARHRLDPCATRPRGGGHLRLPALANQSASIYERGALKYRRQQHASRKRHRQTLSR